MQAEIVDLFLGLKSRAKSLGLDIDIHGMSSFKITGFLSSNGLISFRKLEEVETFLCGYEHAVKNKNIG